MVRVRRVAFQVRSRRGRGGRVHLAVVLQRRRAVGCAFLQLRQFGELLEGHHTDRLRRLHVRLHLFKIPLELGAAVLEPGDDLRVGETQLLGDLVAVRRAQVLLVQEALLQLVDLVVGEGRARLSSLFGSIPLAEQRQSVPTCERGYVSPRVCMDSFIKKM